MDKGRNCRKDTLKSGLGRLNKFKKVCTGKMKVPWTKPEVYLSGTYDMKKAISNPEKAEDACSVPCCNKDKISSAGKSGATTGGTRKKKKKRRRVTKRRKRKRGNKRGKTRKYHRARRKKTHRRRKR